MKKKRRPQKVNISSAASIQMNRNRAKKVWDALAPIDKHPYDTFEKFFKTKDWKTPERIDSSLKDSDYNLFAQDGKVIHLFGQNFDLKSYKKTWVPSMYKIFQDENKNTEFKNYPLKIATESFGKYWNSESLYPRSRNAFIDEFFDDRDPKGLEGIWNEPHWGIIGIVKKGSVYQRYNIKITTFDKKLFKGGFFDEEKGKNIEGFEIDGTSDGAFIPTNNKRKFKLDGRNISFIPSSDGYVVPINEIVTATVNVVNDNLYYIRPPYGDQEFKGERVWPGGKVASDDTMSAPSSGTAFFVDNSGHIITNYHVVESCNDKSKIYYNNKKIDVKLIAKDKQLDLALLKADVKNKYFIKITNKSIRKLQPIIAAGYPFGKHLSDDLKFTSGIISSLKGYEDNTSQMQIDAALNPGNSGGPIVDQQSGHLVGVAVSILRKDMTEGVNFAIKASQVIDFLESNKIKNKKWFAKKTKLNTTLENSTVYIFCN